VLTGNGRGPTARSPFPGEHVIPAQAGSWLSGPVKVWDAGEGDEKAELIFTNLSPSTA